MHRSANTLAHALLSLFSERIIDILQLVTVKPGVHKVNFTHDNDQF